MGIGNGATHSGFLRAGGCVGSLGSPWIGGPCRRVGDLVAGSGMTFFALRSTAGEGILDKPFPQDEARLHDLFTGPAAARAGADFPALEQVLPGTVLTRSPVLEQAPGAPGWAPGRGNVLPGVGPTAVRPVGHYGRGLFGAGRAHEQGVSAVGTEAVERVIPPRRAQLEELERRRVTVSGEVERLSMTSLFPRS